MTSKLGNVVVKQIMANGNVMNVQMDFITIQIVTVRSTVLVLFVVNDDILV